MVFNATFNNMSVILWQSVLLVEQTGVVIGTDCIGSYKSNNKTDCHNITDILLKVALNTITPNPPSLGL